MKLKLKQVLSSHGSSYVVVRDNLCDKPLLCPRSGQSCGESCPLFLKDKDNISILCGCTEVQAEIVEVKKL